MPAKPAIWVLICLGAMTAGIGCGGKPVITSSYHDTSVPKLLQMLPNLQAFGVETCSVDLSSTTSSSGLPAPSDTRVEIRGFATLSEAGFKKLRADFGWEPLVPDSAPQEVRAIIPAGSVLVSPRFNESFNLPNPTFKHGFVMFTPDDRDRKIVFLATDLDHPIK